MVFALTGNSSAVSEPGAGALTRLVLAGLAGAQTLRLRARKD
jgi:hypothetical protein